MDKKKSGGLLERAVGDRSEERDDEWRRGTNDMRINQYLFEALKLMMLC